MLPAGVCFFKIRKAIFLALCWNQSITTRGRDARNGTSRRCYVVRLMRMSPVADCSNHHRASCWQRHSIPFWILLTDVDRRNMRLLWHAGMRARGQKIRNSFLVEGVIWVTNPQSWNWTETFSFPSVHFRGNVFLEGKLEINGTSSLSQLTITKTIQRIEAHEVVFWTWRSDTIPCWSRRRHRDSRLSCWSDFLCSVDSTTTALLLPATATSRWTMLSMTPILQSTLVPFTTHG